MFLIGLTGGIAAGKSTVAKHWQTLGGIEIDADQLAREVVAPNTIGALKIRERFGAQFFDTSGNLDRSALAKLVFSDSIAKSDLENIVHPLVQAKAKEILSSMPKQAIAIYTVPLLVEAKVALPFDVVVTVEASEEIRIQRLIESRKMSREEAAARIKNQAQPVERVSRADYVLNSNQPIELLIADASSLWKQFQQQALDKN